MREIRFRAWDKSFEQMVEWEELKFDKDPGDKHICFYEQEDGSDSVWNGGADYILMQYTGLKDKNGKEIYEGDIVKGHWWENGNKHRHIGRIAYVMNAFKVRGVKQYLGMDDDLNPTYEIIGNIYKNKHLLESEVTE